jgi:hypothetical protein
MSAQHIASIAGITLSVDQWTALSAIATAFAAIVALGAGIAAVIVPSRIANAAQAEARRVEMERRAETERADEARRQELREIVAARYHEVASATYNALDLVVEAADAVNSREGRDGLPILAAQCRSSAETLGILARQPGLTDGAIDSCCGAQHALLAIVRANEFFRSENLAEDPWYELDGCLLIAQQVMRRIGGVVEHHRIPVRQNRGLPVLPESMRPAQGLYIS